MRSTNGEIDVPWINKQQATQTQKVSMFNIQLSCNLNSDFRNFFLGAKWNNAFQSSSQPFNGSWKHRLVEALIHNTMHVVFFWGYTYWFWWTLIFSKYSIVISLQPSSKHLANPLSHYGIHHSITLQGDLAANATKPVFAFPCRCKLNQKWKLDSSCHLAH